MQKLERIGRNIATLRQSKGLTQEDLAGAMEIDRSYLSNMENGQANFSVMVLLKLAEALDTRPDVLLKT